jgi:hypothetical protein
MTRDEQTRSRTQRRGAAGSVPYLGFTGASMSHRPAWESIMALEPAREMVSQVYLFRPMTYTNTLSEELLRNRCMVEKKYSGYKCFF